MQEIVKKSLLDKNFLTECTPGYYNFEGQTNRLVARNTSYGGGPVAYAKLLEQHAQENKLRGLELFYEKDLNKPKL